MKHINAYTIWVCLGQDKNLVIYQLTKHILFNY